MDLVELVYRFTDAFPDNERFNLVSQIRRSAVSIPSNISEGYGRKSDGEFAQFLRIAYGSAAELETQVLLSGRLKFIGNKDQERILEELTIVRKMLNKLLSTVRKAKS